MERDPLLVVIVGPTASGKTALSVALAERFAGEIVSCDSVAVYRGFEIGTAKPSREERARVPHHLLDVAEPTDHPPPDHVPVSAVNRIREEAFRHIFEQR